MSLPRWLPRPAAWVNAVALLLFAKLLAGAASLVMPLLLVLLRHWPRVGWMGMLLLWLAPIAAAAAIYAALDRVIASGEKKSAARGPGSGGSGRWWAGVVAWGEVILVSTTTALVWAVVMAPDIGPPRPDGVAVSVAGAAAETLATALSRGTSGLVQTVVWILLAAYVCELRSRADEAKGGSA